jgi:hypothetical protein
MAGTIVVDKLESDSSYNSTINIASPINIASDINIGGQLGTLGNRNIIVNGSMQIAQRNGSSSTVITGSSSDYQEYHDVDRFANAIRFGSIRVQQSTDVPAGQGFRFSKQITCTTVTPNTTHNYCEVAYNMEGYDCNSIGWDYNSTSSYVTCSFWAKSSIAGTYTFQLRNPAEKVITKEYTLASNTWTKVVATFPGESTGVCLNAASTEFRFLFTLDAGTAYTDSASPVGSWFTPTGENYYRDLPQRFMSNLNATFNITGFQVEPGQVATPFQFTPFQDELRRCMRYYQKSRPYPTGERATYSNGYPFDSQGYGNCLIASDDGAAGFSIEFPVEMRASPTVYTVKADGTVSTSMLLNSYNTIGQGVMTGQGPNSSSRRIFTYASGVANVAQEISCIWFVNAENY